MADSDRDEFAGMGVPFPLFAAPAEEACEYVGRGHCAICDQGHGHCFSLGIGADVIVRCPHCRETTAVDADDRESDCHRCGRPVPLKIDADLEDEEGLVACYQCVRAGKVSLTKDTEFGMIRWVDAMAGATHGNPALTSEKLNNNAFELTPPNDDGWIGVTIPRPVLLELTRTPTPLGIQQEQWLFHCSAAMVYLGPWKQADFDRAAPSGKGRALFERLAGVDAKEANAWDGLAAGTVGAYAYRCRHCGALRVTWDLE